MDKLVSISDKLKEEAERLLESVHQKMSLSLEFVDVVNDIKGLREDFILREAYLTSLENEKDIEDFGSYQWRRDYLLFLSLRKSLGQHLQFCHRYEDKKIKNIPEVYSNILN